MACELFFFKVYWLRLFSFKFDICLSELVFCVFGQFVCSLCENSNTRLLSWKNRKREMRRDKFGKKSTNALVWYKGKEEWKENEREKKCM